MSASAATWEHRPSTLTPIPGDGTFVLELSSYQLDLTVEATFDVAVLLNVAPDHLDRHGTMTAYVDAKRQIFRPGRLETARRRYR